MNSFLPSGYEVPKGSSEGFMKFEAGPNRFRILDSAIIGFELWVEGRPVRKKTLDAFTSGELLNADVNTFTGEKKNPVHFWAFPVWNYKEEKVQILEITQKTIQEGMSAYIEDPEWGTPFEYDFSVNKSEEDKKVKYIVQTKPHKELDSAIKELYTDMNINLKALYEGKNPFDAPMVMPSDEEVDPDEVARAIDA